MITATELRNLRERRSIEDYIIKAILEEHSVNGGTRACIYFKKEEFTTIYADLHRLAIKFMLLGYNLDYKILPEDSILYSSYQVLVRVSWD